MLHKRYGYYSIHAEVAALLKSNGDVLVVTRIQKDGRLACSKPCSKCMKFLRDRGIKKVYYTDWNSSVQEIDI